MRTAKPFVGRNKALIEAYKNYREEVHRYFLILDSLPRVKFVKQDIPEVAKKTPNNDKQNLTPYLNICIQLDTPKLSSANIAV